MTLFFRNFSVSLACISRNFSVSLTCMSAAFLASCGDNNPYKARDKKCKVNCDNQDAVPANEKLPRTNTPLSLALNFWETNTPRSELSREQKDALASSNPFNIANEVLSKVKKNAQTGREYQGSKEKFEACSADQFVNPPKPLGEGYEWNADYGRCYPLAMLNGIAENDRAKARARGQDSPKLTYLGFEQGFRFAFLNPQSLNAQALSLVESTQQAALLDQNILFAPTTSRDFSCSEQDCQPLALTFGFGDVRTTKVESTKSKTVVDRYAEWTGAGFASEPAKALITQYKDGGQSLSLTGSLYRAATQTLNPKAEDPFQGSARLGWTLEFQFVDFKLTGTSPRLDTGLGFGPNVLLNGVYFIYVNYSFDPSLDTIAKQPKGATRYAAVGRNEVCLVNLFLINDDNTTERPKVVDLCQGFNPN